MEANRTVIAHETAAQVPCRMAAAVRQSHVERDTVCAAISSMVLLGRVKATDRVAAFLIGLMLRYRGRGFSPSELVVPMARADIGNYLELSLETVSRCLTRLKNAGLIEVDKRRLHILDPDGLHEMIGLPRSQRSNNAMEM